MHKKAYGFLKTIGHFLFSYFIKRIFYSSVLSEIYHVESEFKDNSDKLKYLKGENKINNKPDNFEKGNQSMISKF